MAESSKVWYHGTPDARKVKEQGGFEGRTNSITFITDIEKWEQIKSELKDARKNDEGLYFKLLDQVGQFTKDLSLKKPIFLSDNHGVARTYADQKRAFDYQNAEPDTFKVKVDSGKNLKIPVFGDTFRGINIGKVKKALLNHGISDSDIDRTFKRFQYNIKNDKMDTSVVSAIAQMYDFDIVDVVGVLDSYNVGKSKSTVRMVFDHNRVKIINNETEIEEANPIIAMPDIPKGNITRAVAHIE